MKGKAGLRRARQDLQRLGMLLRSRLRGSPEGELYDSCIILKNLAIVKQQKSLSADVIYEMLLRHAVRLRPAYAGMLSLYRGGQDQEAFEFFAEAVGTKAGKTFASILSKLDEINPAELTTQMRVFQNMMIEKRVTAAMKRVQRNSLLITLWSSAAIFAMLINFTVVVVFLQTLDTLQTLF